MRTSNPALRQDLFTKAGMVTGDVMTMGGTVLKAGVLLILMLFTAGWSWSLFSSNQLGTVQTLMIVGALGGLLMAIITIFRKPWAMITAPLYAILEGFFLGGISAFFENSYPGIVIQAVGLTFSTLAGMLLLYQTGVIRATPNFRRGIIIATFGVFALYLVSFIARLFGGNIPYIHDSGLIGIGFSLVVIAIAAFNLVLDFDFIEQGAQMGAPKYMEWYGAFGLMVTLVWLYIEILRLLAKLNRRR
jgi:uncharacterized YccA/Bax inhibitor family protein